MWQKQCFGFSNLFPLPVHTGRAQPQPRLQSWAKQLRVCEPLLISGFPFYMRKTQKQIPGGHEGVVAWKRGAFQKRWVRRALPFIRVCVSEK